jgi:hypothetical protein
MTPSPAEPSGDLRHLAPDMGPARCPNCGESQNVAQGAFDPAREPFGPLNCMVCGHTFTRREFQAGIRHLCAERRSER